MAISDEQRRRGLDNIRHIRSQLNHQPADPNPLIVDVPLPAEPDTDDGDPDLHPDAIKYQLELAAHRETTQRLLDEKDRTIDALRDLVETLRRQLDRAQGQNTSGTDR